MLQLNQIGQIALTVSDIRRSEDFYGAKLGLRPLFNFGNITFFDCAGVRLMLSQAEAPAPGSVIYFRVADLPYSVAELKGRGVEFVDEPHRIAPMEDHDLWMTFFKDPDGNLLALMQEAPKGWTPS